MPSGSLQLHLLRARGLKHGDLLSKTDPYVIITCGNYEQKSNVASNQGSNPTWNQAFTFNVREGTDKLLLKIMDEDFFTADDHLGTATVPLDDVFLSGQTAEKAYAVVLPNGKFKGEVTLSMTFKPQVGSSHGARHNSHGDHQFSSGIHGPYSSSGTGGWTQGSME